MVSECFFSISSPFIRENSLISFTFLYLKWSDRQVKCKDMVYYYYHYNNHDEGDYYYCYYYIVSKWSGKNMQRWGRLWLNVSTCSRTFFQGKGKKCKTIYIYYNGKYKTKLYVGCSRYLKMFLFLLDYLRQKGVCLDFLSILYID